MKALIRNEKDEVLVVKESGRDWWDLPGGGMDHGEDIKSAIARELREEVDLQGDFTYRVISVDDPMHLVNADVLQVRLIFEVFPNIMPSMPGPEADSILYMKPELLKVSGNATERRVYDYYQIVQPK